MSLAWISSNTKQNFKSIIPILTFYWSMSFRIERFIHKLYVCMYHFVDNEFVIVLNATMNNWITWNPRYKQLSRNSTESIPLNEPISLQMRMQKAQRNQRLKSCDPNDIGVIDKNALSHHIAVQMQCSVVWKIVCMLFYLNKMNREGRKKNNKFSVNESQ